MVCTTAPSGSLPTGRAISSAPRASRVCCSAVCCISRPFAFAIANMCVHRDAGRIATDMLTHFPAISSIFPIREPCSRAARINAWTFWSLSSGTRNEVVFESHRKLRYRCILDGFRSHLVSDRKQPQKYETGIST